MGHSNTGNGGTEERTSGSYRDRPKLNTSEEDTMETEDRIEVTGGMSEAAESLIASLQNAFNSHDPVAISEHFAEKAAWATVRGRELDAGARRSGRHGSITAVKGTLLGDNPAPPAVAS
jgi:hypothetical protein